MKARSGIIFGIKRNEITVSLLALVIYSVGVAGIADQQARDLFITLIPSVILLSLAAVLVFQKIDKRTAVVFSTIIILAWLVEAYGVATGKIFGSYSYGPVLGIKLFQTPVIIGFNWLLLACGSAAITSNIKQPVVGVFSASALMLLYDIALEHMAPRLGMWEFEGGTVPLKNYFAWFLLAALIHSGLRMAGIRINSHVAAFIFVIQCMFFIVLAIFFNLSR